MLFVRPLIRAATNVLVWIAALWGFELTTDLELLIGSALVIGAINFALALHDERRIESESKLVAELRDFVKAALPSSGVPPHLQDLRKLSNAQIKNAVGKVTGKMRAFAAESRNSAHDRESLTANFHQRHRPDALALWNELKRRGANGDTIKGADSASILHGFLGGPSPIEDGATALETLARKLKDSAHG